MARANKKAVSSTAKSRPVIKSNVISSEELPVAPEKTVSFDDGVRKEVGSNAEINSNIEIESNIYDFSNKAKMLAFFEEPITVILSEGTEKDAEKYVYLAVNGLGAGPLNTPWVPRGVEVTIKRKFLNVLAGARKVRYTNYEYTDNDGTRKTAQRASAADAYPFQVIEDPNPIGREWLKQLRAMRRAG